MNIQMNELHSISIRDTCCPKFLKNGLMQNGIKGVYDVRLKHHLIMMDV
jgi:hypothetical protein